MTINGIFLNLILQYFLLLLITFIIAIYFNIFDLILEEFINWGEYRERDNTQ